MKKYVILTAIMLSVVILFDCGFIYLLHTNTVSNTKESLKTLEISGDPIDNYSNNFLSGGELCRIENKLYFVDSGGSKPIIVQITNTGSKKLNSNKSFILNDGAKTYLYQTKNSLYQFNDTSYELSSYDFEKNAFSKKLILENYGYDLYIDQSICYYSASRDEYSDYYDESYTTYDVVMTDGNRKDVIISGVNSFYETENYIYYTQYNSDGFDFIEYDKEMNNNRTVLTLDNSYGNVSVGYFVVQNGSILFSSGANNNVLYKFKINSTDRPQKLFEQGTNINFNSYGGVAYVYTEKDIYAVNIETGEVTSLVQEYKKTIYCVYVVDNKWVYYSDNDGGELCRVLQTGSAPEVVYK